MTDASSVLCLIRDRVRLRFAVPTLDTFANYVVDKAREASDREVLSIERLEGLYLDDLYLAAACSMNQHAAWEEVDAAHFAFLRRFARRFLREPDAGDVADHVIADLWEHGKIARYSGRSSLRTWLGVIVAHAAINAAKSARAAAFADRDSADDVLCVADGRGSFDFARESGRLLAKLIVEVLRELPPDDKLLLLMHYEQGLTLEEMGRVIGGSRATLSRRLRDARARLWAALDELADRRAGVSAKSLKDGIDFARLDFDLETAVGAVRSMDRRRKDVI